MYYHIVFILQTGAVHQEYYRIVFILQKGAVYQEFYHIVFIFQTGAVHQEYYHDSDLTVGTVLNVWGRKFTLCDCDEFTKEYYKTKYGVSK